MPQNENGASGREPPTPDITTTLLRSDFSEDFQSLGLADDDAVAARWAFLHARRIPDDLTERDQWVLWRREGGTKVPYRIDGRKASTTNATDWSEYQAVVESFNPRTDAGVGFVLGPPFVGIDLDDCLEDCTGNPKPCIRGLIERFSDTYMEISPSGLGLKIWCRGKLPSPMGKVRLQDGCGLEIYDRERYFTVTGNAFRNAPLQIEDHAADVITLFNEFCSRDANECELPKYDIPPEGKIPYGTQHLTLVSLAGTLRRRRVCDAAIEACLQAVNRYQCERPGPQRNISRIVRSTRPWGRV